ncbi:Rieske (2Fe-2S) protein [Pedobacter metabolipauper]|uniref:3-phenylpropionate/trans-cinnamate dioxygenase ferredoxin subunit n=1 Tax=Pedobacter metabolipauper TaxID=425513 RepID=A0A4R6T0K8_9SPHI|nr:Rieske (2Fe-2S) protein [Pedobacter metabolipauper]TDQ11952.1 3-phenylpropionate/trans-cinnamate dioxygenase ferredoxin subunit [Pedobacter metabolipauper]
MNWVKIEEKIPDHDFVLQVTVRGKKLCLVKNEGEFYLVQNSCPHAGGTLSGGWCKNGHLICPVHRWEYSLKTGRGAEGQGDYIDRYPVEIRPDGIYAGFKESWLKKLWR